LYYVSDVLLVLKVLILGLGIVWHCMLPVASGCALGHLVKLQANLIYALWVNMLCIQYAEILAFLVHSLICLRNVYCSIWNEEPSWSQVQKAPEKW